MSLISSLFATSRPRWIAFFVVLLAVVSLTGCVRRRMTIRSNPVGALVYVDDYEIGTTPISHNFTYYGTRKVRLVKDGYETLTVMQPMRPPWWQIPPIDFITENILPGELTDNRSLSYQMTRQRVVPPDELRARAEHLRSQMQPACYIEPVASGLPNQPVLRSMPPGEMAPIGSGGMQPGMINTPTYPQRGEWVAPPNTMSQPQYHQPQPGVQPNYGQPVQPNYGQPAYRQPTQPNYNQPTYRQPTQPNYNQPAYGQPTQPNTYPPSGSRSMINSPGGYNPLPSAFPPSQPM